MGCAQGKQPGSSPARGLETMKMRNGYVGKAALVNHRRSTGQKYTGRLNNSDPAPKNHAGEKQPSDGTDGGWGSGSGKDSVKERALPPVDVDDEGLVDGWPKWLVDNVPKEVLANIVPKSAESYEKIDKVGQGTYSNVYKARDRDSGKIVALKKVRFETSEPESVKFMAREIMFLQKLDHPHVVKLEGIATSRMQYSIYLVFDFMRSDLSTIITRPDERLTEPQIKCYMHQLLSGLQHCHDREVLHRDIKGSNLLIDGSGMLKIADFGLANYYYPKNKRPLTSRVVTLWYRAPELLLGSTNYGVGIDLWSAGCLMAEMFAGRPLMPGRTEVEQLHRIFKLCGTPSDDYWKKLRVSTTFRPPQYKPSLYSTFGELPESSLGLLTTLLALDPAIRGSASTALQSDFFYTSPLACDLSGLPVIQQGQDELAQSNKRRRRKGSKIPHRSQTQRERRKKNLGDIDNHEEDSAPPKVVQSEEPEELVLLIQQTGSSSSSASTGIGFLLSPVQSSNKKKSPNSIIKDLPPLPSTKTARSRDLSSNAYRLNQVHRSASTREFRKPNHVTHLEQLYAVDD